MRVFFFFFFFFFKWSYFVEKKKKSTREWPYFLDNVLVGVRVVFLPNSPLILSLLNHRDVGVFLN